MSVHRLVQAVTLAQLPAEVAVAWRQAAGALIEAALPSHDREPANWPVYAALLPHAQVALTTLRMGMGRVAGYLRHIGNYTAARALTQPHGGSGLFLVDGVLASRPHSRLPARRYPDVIQPWRLHPQRLC